VESSQSDDLITQGECHVESSQSDDLITQGECPRLLFTCNVCILRSVSFTCKSLIAEVTTSIISTIGS